MSHRLGPSSVCVFSCQEFGQGQANIDAGAPVVMPAESADVLTIAERISSKHTRSGGHRFIDLLPVATALHLGAVEFLSCDANQRKLAAAEGLAVSWLRYRWIVTENGGPDQVRTPDRIRQVRLTLNTMGKAHHG